MISYDIYSFHYFSLLGLLNRLNDLNVEVKKYYEYNGEFYIKINRKYRNIIRENFKDYKIVEKLGIVNRLEQLVFKPITLVSLLLSIALFFDLSSRIYKINISGDYPVIEENLLLFLKENGVSPFMKNIKQEDIKKVSALVKEEFNDELEFLEIVKSGGVINLNYKRRRKEVVIEGKKGSLYASKDGVIKGFELLSGVKNVKVYDFVKKGDLLVSDILITSNNENIVIGTIGKVFALTFYYIEVNCKKDDEALTQACLLDKARYEVSKNINSNDEYIESENILVNDVNKGYLKVYYVLYEDITI